MTARKTLPATLPATMTALLLLTAGSPALADGLPPLVGAVDAAFGPDADWLSDAEETEPSGRRSGFDIRGLWIEADPVDGRLRIAIQMIAGAVAGDSDGDGDPDRGEDAADAPRFGDGERLAIDFDLDLDGAADLVLGVGPDGDLDDCALADPSAPDAPLAGCRVAAVHADAPDLVIDVPGFTPVLEARMAPEAHPRRIGVRALVDSAHDTRSADRAPEAGAFYPLCPYGRFAEESNGVDDDCDGRIDEDDPQCEGDCGDMPELPMDGEAMGCSARPGGSGAPCLVAWGVLLLLVRFKRRATVR